MLIKITYNAETKEPAVPEKPGRIIRIDIGVDNFFAYGGAPILIDDRWLKSMNRQFNKERARLMSCLSAGEDSAHSEKHSRCLDAISRKREAAIRDFFYKADANVT